NALIRNRRGICRRVRLLNEYGVALDLTGHSDADRHRDERVLGHDLGLDVVDRRGEGLYRPLELAAVPHERVFERPELEKVCPTGEQLLLEGRAAWRPVCGAVEATLPADAGGRRGHL